MNGFVTIEPLGHQSLRRASHRQLGISHLVLDDDVNDSVQSLPREANPGTSMIPQHSIDPFLFVQRKPLIRMWLQEWIIPPSRA
ncbi:hypothetical protein SAMN04487925_109195 [Bradyrhizobium sp. cf659]|nr:hypothetical protein SAMN04487925_109195 [Bradyrhizobium sp. cf659]